MATKSKATAKRVGAAAVKGAAIAVIGEVAKDARGGAAKDAVHAIAKTRVTAEAKLRAAKTKPRVDAVTAKTKPRVDAVTAKTKPRVDAATAKAKPRVDAAKARASRVKAKIKSQLGALKATRSARSTRVKAAVAKTRKKLGRTGSTKSRVRGSTAAATSTARTKSIGGRTGSSKSIGRQSGSTKVVTGSVDSAVKAAVAIVSLPEAKPRPTRIRAAVAAVKAKLVKGRRVVSTEEASALAIADAHEAAKPTPANENASITPARTTARLETIAPRGVFLPDRVVVDVEGDTFPSTKLDDNGRDEAILSSSTFEELKRQVAEGQRLVDDDPTNAFRAFRAALELLPEPVQNWNAAGWLLVAMGECAIRTGDFAAAFAPLKDAMHCPGTIGNPWVHLRLGQCRLVLGDERAADELARAYMGGGRALFEGVDPKCFALVESVLKPPPGHDRLP